MRQLYCSVGLFLLFVLLAGGFPYIRNLWLTGNPLFPASIAFIEGPFGKAQQNATKLFYWIFKCPTHWEHWRVILKGYTDWPVQFFLLSLAGYGFAVKSYFFDKNNDKKLTFTEQLSLFMGLFFVFIYPLMPFSGSTNSPTDPLTLQPRYVLFSYLIGIFLLLGRMSEKNKISQYTFLFLIVAINFRYGIRVPKITCFTAILAASWLFVEFSYRNKELLLEIFLSKKSSIAILTGFLIGFLLFIPKFQKTTNERVYNYHGQMESVLRTLEKLDEGSSLCAFGLDYRTYPLWGRRFQLSPVFVDLNGQPRGYFYRLWKEHPERAVFWYRTTCDFEPTSLVDNLRGSQIRYVLTSRLKTNDWPQQHGVLSRDASVAKIYEDAMNCIWDIQSESVGEPEM